MNKLTNQRKAQKRKLIERVNLKLKGDIEKIFEKQDEIFKLDSIIKRHGIEDIGVGRIYFGKQLSNDQVFEYISKSIFDLPSEYGGDFVKFYTKYNKKNPLRVEISLEKKEAPYGAISYCFGKWSMIPYWDIDRSYIFRGVLYPMPPPKHALVVFRPEKIKKNKEIIDKLLEDEFGYQTTHIRFGNDFEKLPYASLVLSRYMSNQFKFCGREEDILDRWGFLIPGIKECYQYYKAD